MLGMIQKEKKKEEEKVVYEMIFRLFLSKRENENKKEEDKSFIFS